MRKTEKEDNSVMDFENITSGHLTLDTIYDPNSMLLAQAVLEIFCSQASIWL